MKRKYLTGLAAGLFFIATAGMANANLITNGSFETGTSAPTGSFSTLSVTSTAIDGWTVSFGSVDWINTYWAASDGERSLDMAGYNSGHITSDPFGTEIGATYNVTFDMASNFAGPDATLEMALGIDHGGFAVTNIFSFVRSGQTSTNMGWQEMSLSFVATSTSTALFFGTPDYWEPEDDNWSVYGPALDNVVVTKFGGGEPVPEPATMLLFGTGLITLAGSRLRKKKK